jgi:hypothetical protein
MDLEMETGPTNDIQPIRFRFIKGNFFRVIHADGARGGIDPRGHIQFALYNERRPIPRVTAMEVRDGQPTPERIEEEEPGMVREVEVEIIMELDTAVSFHRWLGDKIETLRGLLKQEKKS